MHYRTVGKFRGSKVSRFVSFPLFSSIIFRGGMSRPFNCTGVVGVKFRNFNPTMELTKFKPPRNLPTIRMVYMLYVNNADSVHSFTCTCAYMYVIMVMGHIQYRYTVYYV